EPFAQRGAERFLLGTILRAEHALRGLSDGPSRGQECNAPPGGSRAARVSASGGSPTEPVRAVQRKGRDPDREPYGTRASRNLSVSDSNVGVPPSIELRRILRSPRSPASVVAMVPPPGSVCRANTSSRVAAEPSWKYGAAWPMPLSDGGLKPPPPPRALLPLLRTSRGFAGSKVPTGSMKRRLLLPI